MDSENLVGRHSGGGSGFGFVDVGGFSGSGEDFCGIVHRQYRREGLECVVHWDDFSLRILTVTDGLTWLGERGDISVFA